MSVLKSKVATSHPTAAELQGIVIKITFSNREEIPNRQISELAAAWPS